MTDLRALKIEAARAALESVRDGMIVGLGTGSTAEEFIKLIGEAIRTGRYRSIEVVCTSKRTEHVARGAGIPMTTCEMAGRIDLAVDGADEIDPQLRLIKGRGGALLREKVVEQAAAKFIVIADHTKQVQRLGAGPLPVVIVPFAEHLLMKRFDELDLHPALRMNGTETFVSDDGNFIIDVTIPATVDIAEVVNGIYWFAGVIDTGFFPEEATEAIIATPDGIRRERRQMQKA